MKPEELDLWWSKLEIIEKERIASKLMKQPMKYPMCTVMWNALEVERKQYIHDHVTDYHGTQANQDKEGQSMSY